MINRLAGREHGRFDVWAPAAERVQVQLDGQRHRLEPGENGWFRLDPDIAASVPYGVDYGYLLDDADTPRPDPRSRWQPDGVHGLSRSFDPLAHAWQDRAWHGRPVEGAVILELHIGTFTPDGTLDAAIDKLDHLVELGVDFVELLPVNAFNGTHNWGYDGVLWYAVHHTYGGPAAYQRFVDACHQRGLGVIQDVVHNHLGASGNYLPEFGPYLADAGASTWGAHLNLDGPGSDVVRAHILDNALMWLRDMHVDGLRLDAVHALVDHTAVHLLEEMATEVDALAVELGRPLALIAESDLNDPRLITSREAGGYGLTGQWSDDFHHAVITNLSKDVSGWFADFDGLDAVTAVINSGFFHAGTLSTFRGRRHGRPLPATIPTTRLVVCTANHDQIGNRADGSRPRSRLGQEQLAIAATLCLLSANTPMLFMGEEWGASTPWAFFTSHPEPELAEATRQGRLTEFARLDWDPSTVPDPQDPHTFERSRLDWSEVEREPYRSLLEHHRALIRLRRELPALGDPRRGVVTACHGGPDQWLRIDAEGVRVAVNFSDRSVTVPLSGTDPWQRRYGFGPAELVVEGDGGSAVRLGPYGQLVAVAVADSVHQRDAGERDPRHQHRGEPGQHEGAQPDPEQ